MFWKSKLYILIIINKYKMVKKKITEQLNDLQDSHNRLCQLLEDMKLNTLANFDSCLCYLEDEYDELIDDELIDDELKERDNIESL